MASSFLGGRRDVGEPRVKGPAARGCLACDDCRAKQWMSESHPVDVKLEDPRVERFGEPWIAPRPERGFQERDGRVGQRGDGARDLERRRAEAVDARVQKLVEVRGNRELLAGRERSASALERVCELEREEGVAARGLPEPD